LERFPNGRCRSSVRLGWTQGKVFTGEAEGTQTKQGELQASASAAMNAAASSVGGRLGLELRGVKAVRAFDSWVVVVSVSARSGTLNLKLLGAFPCVGMDTARGAVMAVLNAVNRVLQPYLEP
jgi:hypothetical protein